MWRCRTVERRKLLQSSRASCVQPSRNPFLPCTGFAGYQNGHIRGANLVNLLEHAAHCAASADKAREFDWRKQPCRIKNLCSAVFAAKNLGLEPLFDDKQQGFHVD